MCHQQYYVSRFTFHVSLPTMAETIGSLADKITIIELKRYYMKQQTERADVSEEHRRECQDKLRVLNEQCDDLIEEVDLLFQDIMSGKRTLKVYRQYKMYNDLKYRLLSEL